MKRFTLFLCMSLLTLLGACAKSPTPQDVVGTWGNPDGATLTLDANGQFSARALPQAVFFRLDKKFGSSVDGKGIWKLQKGQAYWEVRLSFREMAGQPASFGVSVLVSGSGASTYLYEWKGEEGEGLYKLDRKSPAAAQKPETEK